jgi:putative MFS transporter
MTTADVLARQKAKGDEVVARLERLPFSGFHTRLMALLGVGTFFDAFDTLAIASALTLIFATLHISLAEAGLLGGIAYIGEFFGAIVFGVLSERIGRKWSFLVSLAFFGLMSLISAFAWNFQSLFWIRLLEGVGLGGEVPIAGALFNEYVQGSRRGRYVLFYEALFPWGLFLTPLISIGLISWVGPAMGWRLLFGIGGVVPIVWAALGVLLMPESVRWLVDKGEVARAEEVVAGMEAGLTRQGRALPPVTVTVRADVKPTRFGELFSPQYARRTALTWILWFMTYFVTYGFQVWLPSLYVRVGHLPPTRGLLLTAVTSALSVIVAYVTASLIDSVGRRPLFLVAFVLIFLGGVLGFFEVFAFHLTTWVALFVAAIVMQVGYSVCSMSVYTYTPELYPTRMRGWGTAAGSSMNRLASFLAPVLVGLVLAARAGIGPVFLMFAGAGVVGFVAMATLGIETKGRPLEELSE